MITAPDIMNSTVEERRNYIKEKYPCIADCDMCGICTVFHGKDAEVAYEASTALKIISTMELFLW